MGFLAILVALQEHLLGIELALRLAGAVDGSLWSESCVLTQESQKSHDQAHNLA
jgi:hypothetical protein